MQIELGKIYTTTISGKRTHIRIDGHFLFQTKDYWLATNLHTNRRIRFQNKKLTGPVLECNRCLVAAAIESRKRYDEKKYDSTTATQKHCRRVQELINLFVGRLQARARVHDQSKLSPEEKPIFDTYTPKLKKTVYGSEEYQQSLNCMSKAISHHYKANRHHPQHFENGINGMTLIDLIEMFIDWKAATERHETGSLQKSLQINARQFKIDPQLAEILENTRKIMGWR